MRRFGGTGFIKQNDRQPHLFLRGPRVSSAIAELEACVLCKQVFFGLCFALYAVSGIHAETIAAGTTIDVRTNDVIDARDAGNGRVYSSLIRI